MAHYELQTSELAEMAPKLRAGDVVHLTGTVYTARDAAHKRIVEAMDAGQEPPFPLEGAAVYYAGPTPAKPGQVIGSADGRGSEMHDRQGRAQPGSRRLDGEKRLRLHGCDRRRRRGQGGAD